MDGRRTQSRDPLRILRTGRDGTGRDGVAVVVVEDVAGSGASVRVPVRVAGAWTDELEARLGHVRAAWPQEVVETAPGAYEWRHARVRRPHTGGTPEAVGRVV
ncbi:DUF5959 family protein [Streptomyces sp. NPDC001822]|uniref:DUF5959 family protein n=1 Tax=Streptomyces sp. NPDC001822 TaxID=3364614 RepID=UPI0036857188